MKVSFWVESPRRCCCCCCCNSMVFCSRQANFKLSLLVPRTTNPSFWNCAYRPLFRFAFVSDEMKISMREVIFSWCDTKRSCWICVGSPRLTENTSSCGYSCVWMGCKESAVCWSKTQFSNTPLLSQLENFRTNLEIEHILKLHFLLKRHYLIIGSLVVHKSNHRQWFGRLIGEQRTWECLCLDFGMPGSF